MTRSVTPSAFDSAVIRGLRERHGIEDVPTRTLEDMRACGAIEKPPTPRLRGFRPDYIAPVEYLDRVAAMRWLIREEKVGRELAALRLLVRYGEAAAPARARELAARQPALLEQARAAEQPLADGRQELLDAIRRGRAPVRGAAVYRVLDKRGAVMLGVRKDERDSTGWDREPAGKCLDCGLDVYLHRGEREQVDASVALLCGFCAARD
jgi:hypothetical protein